MGKYLELFRGEVGDLTEKTKLENKPYVAYSTKLGKVMYTIVPAKEEDNVNYLCFEPLDSNNQLAVMKTSDQYNTQYSFDKITWSEFPVDETNPLNPVFITVDRPIYLKGNNPNGYLKIINGLEGCKIIGLGKYNISGDITTLLNEKGNVKDLTGCDSGCFASLFGELDLTRSYGVIIPAIEVVDASQLILPATTLVDFCYYGMFRNCTSLIAAPELPATILATYCYIGMFNGCTSLTTAPELPAMKLASCCYSGMFRNCTSLIAAPELSATELVYSCYEYMFHDCTSLSYIKCLAKNISDEYMSNWVDGLSSTGTFVKHPNMTSWTTGINGIPEGWDVVDAEV